MAKDWKVIIDDTGNQFSGWPLGVFSEEENRAIIHKDGFIQEYWGCHTGDGPTLKEAIEICNVIANYMNSRS